MMRLATGLLAISAMSAVLAIAAAVPAQAYDRDRIHADRYGNLIIESAAGYKRIIVGEGHRAAEFADVADVVEPNVVYADEGRRSVSGPDCWRPPVLVKGRSYMYGFDQGEIPLQGGPCR
jgi:hypothetical protein